MKSSKFISAWRNIKAKRNEKQKTKTYFQILNLNETDPKFCRRFIFISFMKWCNERLTILRPFSGLYMLGFPIRNDLDISMYDVLPLTLSSGSLHFSIKVYYKYYDYHFKVLDCIFESTLHQGKYILICWKRVILLVNLISYFIVVIIWLNSNCSLLNIHLELWLFVTPILAALRTFNLLQIYCLDI